MKDPSHMHTSIPREVEIGISQHVIKKCGSFFVFIFAQLLF